MDNNNGGYGHLDFDVIKRTLEEMFSQKKFKYPIGTRNHGNGIYSISSGQSIIYTTKAGVEEFNKALQEDFKNYKNENNEEDKKQD